MADTWSGGTEIAFEAELYLLPSNMPHILNVALDVPEAVSRAFGRRGYVPVVGTADASPLVATLVPVGGARHRLFLHGGVRSAIGKGPGDTVRIAVRYDPADRMPPMPEDLEAALEAASAWGAWEALTLSRRKEMLVTLANTKRESTRASRVQRIVSAVLAGHP